MTDEAKKTTVVENVLVSIEDAPHAPFIFFDGVATFGFNAGIVNLTMTAARFLPNVDKVTVKPVVTAHLRCSRDAAVLLRDSIDKALLIGTVPEGAVN